MKEILKLKNKNEYQLIVNGFVSLDDTIQVGFITDKTLEEIVEEFSSAENTGELTVKNANGETVVYVKGFTVLNNVVSMDTNYQVSPAEYDEDGNVTTEAVYGKAVSLSLKKEPIDARVAALEDTIDTLILDSFGI